MPDVHRRPSPDHAAGKLLVIVLVAGALIAALLALKFRVLEPKETTTRPTTQT